MNNLSAINLDLSKEMKVAKRNEITLGKAYLLCLLDSEKNKEYEIF